jgi:hemolysin activation/secretion protein
LENKLTLGLVALFAVGVGGAQYFNEEGEVSTVSLPGAAMPESVEPRLLRLPPRPAVTPLLTLAPEPRRPQATDLLTGLEKVELYRTGTPFSPQQQPPQQAPRQTLVDDPEVLDEIQGFMEIYRGQYTVLRLEQLADELADIYRERGLTLARVTLPAQDLLRPRVVLSLVPGALVQTDTVVSLGPPLKQQVNQTLSGLPADATTLPTQPGDAQLPASIRMTKQGFDMPASVRAVPVAAPPQQASVATPVSSAAQTHAPQNIASLKQSRNLAVASLPDAATPGAAQPAALKSPQRSVPEPSLIIPAKPSRPLAADAGPQISLERIELYMLDTGPEGGRTRVDDAEVLAQIQTFMAQQQGQYTIGRLQQLADELSRMYRGRGLILATVFLPAQDVLDQRVELNLLPGRLASLIPEGQHSYNPEQLGRPFNQVMNQPLLKESIEESLLSLLSYPGLQVTGMLKPGEQLGTASLVLDVAQEDPFEGVVYADNFGSRYTGKERLGLGLVFNNPLGLVDQLQLDLLVQNKPSNDSGRSVAHTLYGGIGYSFRPEDPSYTVGVQASHNQYDVGRDLASFQYDGVTDQLRLHVKKQLVRSRTRNLFVETALASKRAVSERAGQKQSRDALTNLELALDFDLFDRVLRGGYNEGQVRWVHGVEDFLGSMGQDDPDASRTSAGNNKADGDFDKLEFSLQRQQNIAAGSALVIRVNGQYSNDPLVSLEQFGLGGVASVRAYSGAEYMADKGVYAGLELRANAPGFAASEFYSGRSWGQSLQLSVFADYARGYKNAALGGEIEQISLSGVGVGLRLMPSNNLSLNVTLATPLGSTRPSGGKDPQLFVDLSYSF